MSLPSEYIYQGDYSRRCARFAAEQFLKLEQRPTAIFAASDEMALEMIAVFLENDVKIPDDISLVGFDDNPACLFGSVALTTIRQPLFQMAEDAVRQLNAMMTGRAKERVKVILPPDLVIRDSSCAPKNT